MRKALVLLVALLAALAAAGAASLGVAAGERHGHATPATPRGRFERGVVDLFARLPVQDGGRVKPISTLAGFTLLALNGRRGATTTAGERLDPTEWLLDCVFFPEEAMRHPCFLVQAAEVLDTVGLPHEGRSRRDRYSYADLAPARLRIFELASQYSVIEAKDRNAVEGQLVHLAQNLMQFESIAGLVAAAADPPSAADSPALAKVFGGDARPSLADMLEHADDLRPFLVRSGDPHGHEGGGGDAALSLWLDEVVRHSRGLAMLPPRGGRDAAAEWLTPSDVVAEVLFHGASMPDETAALRDLLAVYAACGDAAAFRDRAESFRARVVPLAERRGEYGTIPLEVTFYRARFFHWAQIVFVLGFLLAAFSWIRPSGFFTRGAAASVALATALLAAGIAMRCVIRGRPPVTTLYESILFITAVAAIVSMAAEYVNRRGIALGLATVLGAGGTFLADKYEVQEGVDTMPSLVAVLDTNFWLASHVTTVTIGYGAGLLAGAVGHVYVLARVLGLKKGDAGFFKSLSTMTYGMLAFGLLFSVVGTVLGGIWANESWGRFWGWDPKENGALAIVLWELIVLHARMGGYLRDFGVAMASVFGAVVVASSWWGVNLLGVGLHSYGFTSGILIALLAFYAVEALVLLAGGVHRYAGRAAHTASAPAAAPLPQGAEAVQGGVR